MFGPITQLLSEDTVVVLQSVIIKAVGHSTAAGTAAAIGRAKVAATATATASATAVATSRTRKAGAGAASAQATASGAGGSQTSQQGRGNSQAVGTALGVGRALTKATGQAIATGTVAGVGHRTVAPQTSIGVSLATGSASGRGLARVHGVGNAFANGTALARTPFTDLAGIVPVETFVATTSQHNHRLSKFAAERFPIGIDFTDLLPPSRSIQPSTSYVKVIDSNGLDVTTSFVSFTEISSQDGRMVVLIQGGTVGLDYTVKFFALTSDDVFEDEIIISALADTISGSASVFVPGASFLGPAIVPRKVFTASMMKWNHRLPKAPGVTAPIAMDFTDMLPAGQSLQAQSGILAYDANGVDVTGDIIAAIYLSISDGQLVVMIHGGVDGTAYTVEFYAVTEHCVFQDNVTVLT